MFHCDSSEKHKYIETVFILTLVAMRTRSAQLKIVLDFNSSSALKVEIIWFDIDVNTGFSWRTVEITP